jgi:hypothetical protein
VGGRLVLRRFILKPEKRKTVNIDDRLISVALENIALLPKPILIWGFGNIVKEMLESVPRACEHIDSIFDRNPQEDAFCSIRVLKPHPMHREPRTIIIGSLVRYDEIKQQARNLFPRRINFFMIRPYEVFDGIAPFVLTSMQRSGTHWLKRMLMDLNFCSFTKAESKSTIDEKHGDFNGLFPCLLNGDFYYDHLFYRNIREVIQQYKPKVILLHRDPRDRLISIFFYRFKGKRRAEIDKTVLNFGMKVFLKDEISLLPDRYEKQFFNWMDYGNVICVKYEDLLSDTEKELQKIIKFLSFNTDKNLKEIIAQNSFKKLTNGRKVGEEDIYSHYRKGIIGEWKTYFDPEITTLYKEKMGHVHEQLGYNI